MKNKDCTIIYSLSEGGKDLSKNAYLHKRRAFESYLNLLGVDYYAGKSGEADLYERDVFFSPAYHWMKVAKLLEEFGQQFYHLSKPIDKSEMRKLVKVRCTNGKHEVKDRIVKVLKQQVKGLMYWFYDSHAKQYWAIAKRENEDTKEEVEAPTEQEKEEIERALKTG